MIINTLFSFSHSGSNAKSKLEGIKIFKALSLWIQSKIRLEWCLSEKFDMLKSLELMRGYILDILSLSVMLDAKYSSVFKDLYVLREQHCPLMELQ